MLHKQRFKSSVINTFRSHLIVFAIILFVFHWYQNTLCAQSIEIDLSVHCQQDKRALIGVSFYLPNYKIGAVSDQEGRLRWSLVSNIDTTSAVIIRHIGFRTKQLSLGTLIELDKIWLEEMGFEAKDVVVRADRFERDAHVRTQIDMNAANGQSDRNLANMLQNQSGVSMTGMGSGLAKPVIHGMFGDRISIVKNGGVVQAHLWSREHAPPISGLQSRANISLYKGAETVILTEQSIGGTIVLDQKMPGDINYSNSAFSQIQSNGAGISQGFEYGQQTENSSWKIGWFGALSGNNTTPSYRIQNSSRSTSELQVAWEGLISDKYKMEWSTGWNRQNIGIPNVAHIGSLDDLDEAIARGRPIGSASLNYQIESPKQQVDHIDLQGNLKSTSAKNAVFELSTSLQLNRRKEFDVRRGGRSDVPVTDLSLFDIQLKPMLTFQTNGNLIFKTGLDWNWQKNSNISGTGIRPFIPNYSGARAATFIHASSQSEYWAWEAGFRIGYRYLDAAYFDEFGSLTSEFRSFIPYSALAAVVFEKWEFLHVKLQTGLGYRAPNVAELFASGLHHGASNYELGDPQLEAELGWKSLIQADFHLSDAFLLTSTLHLNNVSDYIYLRYANRNTFTIRGAYPVFEYVQTDALIYGFDHDLSYTHSPAFQSSLSMSYLRGQTTSGRDLPDIQPFNVRFRQSWKIPLPQHRYRPEIMWEVEYNDEQKRFEQEDLFAPPPSSFTLIHAGIKISPISSSSDWSIDLRVNNLLNTEYRRYLNRLRYFVHENGTNVLLNFTYQF